MIWIERFFTSFWELTMEMAPYLLLGFLIAGLMNGVFSKSWVRRKMGKPGLSSTVKASVLGVPLPLCSCGVIPTGVSFYKQGASKGATSSFLISTPQTGIDSILVTYSLMGWAFAIIRPIIAFITGILGGFWVDSSNKQQQEKPIEEESLLDQKKEHWFRRIFVYAFGTFLQDISRWLIIGLVFATLITVFVPQTLFTEYLNNPWLNMLIILAASVPLYVCATASVPIAAALLIKGVSPGAALVFLMAGPATNIATLTVLWKSLGKKTTIQYLISIVLGAIGFGLLIDYALPESWFTYFTPKSLSDGHILPHWLMISSAIILLYLIAQAEILKLIPQKKKYVMENDENTHVYKVEGMTCNHCVATVDKNLNDIDEVDNVSVDLQNAEANVQGNVSSDKIQSIIESIGYQFGGEKK